MNIYSIVISVPVTVGAPDEYYEKEIEDIITSTGAEIQIIQKKVVTKYYQIIKGAKVWVCVLEYVVESTLENITKLEEGMNKSDIVLELRIVE